MWPNPQFPADLVTFTEESFNGKLHFLCSESSDVSNFIENDQKFAPYHLVVLYRIVPKSEKKSQIGTGTITHKGPMNTTNFAM